VGIQPLIQKLSLPIRQRSLLDVARDAIPQALHVLDLLIDTQVVESGRGKRQRLGHRGFSISARNERV